MAKNVVLIILLLLLLLAPRPTSAQQAETFRLPREVAVYPLMSPTVAPIARVAYQTVVTVLGRQPGWIHVRYGEGQQGYLKVAEVIGEATPPAVGAAPTTGAAAQGPCADPLYVELRRKGVNALSEREWVIFQERDRACVAHQLQAKAETPVRPTPPTRTAVSTPAGPAMPVQQPFAQASNPHLREGFWFYAGLGYGTLGCLDCTERVGGISGGLAVGGSPSQHVLLAIATNGWTRSEGGVTLTAGSLSGAIRIYPSSRGGFFFLGGLGVGSADLSIGAVSFASDVTAAAVLGLGYDIRIGFTTSITPFWNGIGFSNDSGDLNWGQIGLGLTIH